MTWERFGYICRKAQADSESQGSISSVINSASKDSTSDIYGKAYKRDTWPNKILTKISSLEDESAINALSIFNKLNLSEQFEEPMSFKRVLAYLSYVLITYLIITIIYQIWVLPSFSGLFEAFGISNTHTSPFANYQKYWLLFFLITIFILLISLFIGLHLRKLFKFHLGSEKSIIFRFLTLPSIRRSYKNLINIIEFPIMTKDSNYWDTPITTHLQTVQNSKMCVAKEMHELLRIEMRKLINSCEKQMKFIYFVVAVIVIHAVISFLSSAYSPIFSLGTVI